MSLAYEITQADLKAKQNLEKSLRNLREYLEQIVAQRYFELQILQLIQDNRTNVVIKRIDNRRFGIFCKTWNIGDYSTFLKEIESTIEKLNKNLSEKTMKRVELYSEYVGLPNDYIISCYLHVRIRNSVS